MSIISYLKTIKIALDQKLGSPEDEENSLSDQMQAFIKEGPCKEALADFQDCVDEAEKKKESMSHCMAMLHKCMSAHYDYYQPLLNAEKAAEEVMMKAFMPSTVSLNEKEKEQANERFVALMRGGCCKESFMAWQDCIYSENAEKIKDDFDTKCSGLYARLAKCMDVHSDYYQPYLAAKKSTEERYVKELKAFFEG